MVPATWANCRSDFACSDGAYVDLVVPGSGLPEWELFWSALRTSPYSLQAFRDGEPIHLPESAAWALAERSVASIMVSLVAGAVTANCHFFGGDLELDIDPREVTSEPAFESVLDIMRLVAAAVRLPILAVSEGGGLAKAFLRTWPDGMAEFLREKEI